MIMISKGVFYHKQERYYRKYNINLCEKFEKKRKLVRIILEAMYTSSPNKLVKMWQEVSKYPYLEEYIDFLIIMCHKLSLSKLSKQNISTVRNIFLSVIKQMCGVFKEYFLEKVVKILMNYRRSDSDTEFFYFCKVVMDDVEFMKK